ncbi:hypothetical protein FRC08_014427 [Ceratobasidium sp. 394]|nr:hypothetical protein FRC08_014427 [Ceratobasidium sp. 394]KAG9094100.1 hypothetical protein FS749_013119 [Ceratobasidium sp. UAMH 11750]
MPLFGGRKSTDANAAPATTPPNETPRRSRSMFSRRRSSATSVSSAESETRRRGSRSASGSGRKGFLGMSRKSDPSVDKDPAVVAARQKLTAAEEAEREADRALEASRRAVLAAREHCKQLETQAIEEARLAKAKRTEARGLGKQAKGLGRH